MFLAILASILLIFTILNEHNESKIEENYQMIIIYSDLASDTIQISNLFQNMKQDIINTNYYTNSLSNLELISEYTTLTNTQNIKLEEANKYEKEVTQYLKNRVTLKNNSKYFKYPTLFLSIINLLLAIFIILEGKKDSEE